MEASQEDLYVDNGPVKLTLYQLLSPLLTSDC